MDTATLARLQFALTIMFHYLFPPLSIGLGALLVFFEGMYLKTGDKAYETITRFWTRIFAVNFAMGVASGIVMEFQFGTNWATYSRFVGDIFGSALAAEGVFAFFLESGFLAVLVFGWDRVSPRMHFFSTVMVSLGSIFSAVWIVVANSWQQTPAGYHIVGEGLTARAEVTDFWEMVFNPSSMHRLVHVILGAFVMGAFFVMSVSAYYLLKQRFQAYAERMFKIALFFACATTLAIFVSGDLQAHKVGETQPAKLAALEGHFKTGPADLYVFGIVDVEREKVHGLAVPGGLSFLMHKDFDAPVTGLDAFEKRDRPPVQITFQAYHLMIALGVYMFALAFGSLFLLWRGTLFKKRWLLKLTVVSVLAPVIANQSGWVAAEVGRQPWIVYGLLRTDEAFSKAVAAEHIVISIVLFAVIYALLAMVWVYVLNDKIRHGPEAAAHPAPAGDQGVLAAAGARTGRAESM
ncbi:MAG: cytochrome ubiquinol oxidase subunit I, partial [Planctomycetota bacterium]|nr:cytochrome ubiquinol oxidase subunit I [Planctomycetota bacterium]